MDGWSGGVADIKYVQLCLPVQLWVSMEVHNYNIYRLQVGCTGPEVWVFCL